MERDQESKEKAPEVVKKEMQDTKNAADDMMFESILALGEMEATAADEHASDVDVPGHKFGLPNLPLPSNLNLKYRYDPAVDQFTKLLMRHGKLSVAQRVRSSVSITRKSFLDMYLLLDIC